MACWGAVDAAATRRGARAAKLPGRDGGAPGVAIDSRSVARATVVAIKGDKHAAMIS